MYWRIGSDYRKRPDQANKADFFELVRQGPPPGLLAFTGNLCVGWCQLTPRAALPWLEKNARLKSVDDLPAWAISCFYVRKGYRRKGVTSALITAALRIAREAGAPAVEAYPLDADLSPSATGTGYLSTFLRMGFIEVARNFPPRPVLRFDFSNGDSGTKKLGKHK